MMREQLWAWVEPALPWFLVFVLAVLIATAAYDVVGVLLDGGGARQGSADVDLWPVVGAVVMPVLGAVVLTALAVYAVVWVAIEVRGAIRRRRRRCESGER